MSKNDCGPGGRMPDELTMQVDGFTMQNNRRNMPTDGLIVPNMYEKASRMQKRFLDGIPSVKEKLCGMWNAIAAYARGRSDATTDVLLKSTESKSSASDSKASGGLEILIEKPGKCDKPPLDTKFIGDAYGTENIIARRNLAANQTLSALAALTSYAWICTFLGWLVSEILAAACGIEVPQIGGLLNEDQDFYKYHIKQFAMKLQTLVVTIIPPFYLVSSMFVAILFTNVILFSTGSKTVTPPHGSTSVSSISPRFLRRSFLIAWGSRAIAWTTNAAATCTSKVRSAALSWWSSKLMAAINLLVFWILYALSTWSYGFASTMDPGFLPENEWPYTGDPFGQDLFIPCHTSGTPDVLGGSHASGTSRIFDSTHTLDSTLGSFHPIATSHHTVNMNGNADRMINMKGRYLWHWDDEETRLWVARQWEGSASSVENEKGAGHNKSTSKSIRRTEWKKFPKGRTFLLEDGVSNTLVNDMATTNTTTARVPNPFHNSLNKKSSGLDIEGEMSDVGISLNFGSVMDVRGTKRPIASGDDRKAEFNHIQANSAKTGKNGEFTDHHLSLYEQKMLYKMAVNHYFDTIFSDNDRMLASGILEASEFTNYIYLNSTAYAAESSSTGYINSAGHGFTGHMNDPEGYIHRHVGTQPVDYDLSRYVQNPIKHERIRPIQYNPTRPIRYDPFRRIFVPYGAQYSGIHGRYVVGLQTYAPLTMKWISGFIGKPIGFRNQKAFSLFLLYSGMLSCYVLIVLGGKMIGLVWHPKSPTLIGAKESASLDESLNRGLLQKSSRKEQMSPKTNQGLTKKATKREVKISISDRESNITDNNYVTTIDTKSTTVSPKINYLFNSYYLNFVVLGWFLLHGICSVSMMQDAFWHGQDVFWNALDNGTGSSYIGSERGIVCNFLPHKACLERNTIQDYIMANKGAAFAEIQDPNTEYPSSDSNHAHTPSQQVSIAQSFLQKVAVATNSKFDFEAIWSSILGVVTGIWNSLMCRLFCYSIAFEGSGPQSSTCTIFEEAPHLQQAFQGLARALGKTDFHDNGWRFRFLGGGISGRVYVFLNEPPYSILKNRCRDFVTKITNLALTPVTTFEAEEESYIAQLREDNPEHIFAPQYPEENANGLFGIDDEVAVSFSSFGAGGEVEDKLILGDKGEDFFRVFFRELSHLMILVSKFNRDGVIHRDIKPQNLVFTSAEPDDNCKVAIIDWDGATSRSKHEKSFEQTDTPPDTFGSSVFMVPFPWIFNTGFRQAGHVLRPNDEYALTLVAACVMLGKSSSGADRLPMVRGPAEVKGPDGEPAPVTCIPQLSRELAGQFGEATDRERKYWLLFIFSYLLLWDLNSILRGPANDNFPNFVPPKPCFKDNHRVVTFANLRDQGNPPQNEETAGQQSAAICEKIWWFAHASLRCLDEPNSQGCDAVVNRHSEEILQPHFSRTAPKLKWQVKGNLRTVQIMPVRPPTAQRLRTSLQNTAQLPLPSAPQRTHPPNVVPSRLQGPPNAVWSAAPAVAYPRSSGPPSSLVRQGGSF